jgi:2Fe-2S ferredoxin
MVNVTVIARDGVERIVDGQAGWSLMEVMRDNGVDDILALCGGCCSCATCHVFVGDEFLDLLPPQSDDENDLLETSPHRSAASRLSCQIECTTALDGIRLHIPPED